MLHVADENAVVSRPFKLGPGDGLRGVKDTARCAFGKPAAKIGMAQPGSSKSLAPQKPGPRKALGDLTNAMKRTSSSMPVKPAQPSSRPVSEPPVEQLAGKHWRVMENELLQQEEAERQQRLDRIAAAARTWTTSHLEISSDEESDSDVSLCEPLPETPIVVQLLAPRRGPGITGPQPGFGFDNDLYSLLPEVSPEPIDFDQCWADDEAY